MPRTRARGTAESDAAPILLSHPASIPNSETKNLPGQVPETALINGARLDLGRYSIA
jgi:hypothetical protein